MKRLCSLFLVLMLLMSLAVMPTLAQEATDLPQVSLYAKTTASTGNMDDMYLYKFIEDKFQIDLKITQISGASWDEKVNLAFSTAEYPDMFLGGLTNSQIQLYGAQGLIVDLKEHVTQEKTPNIDATFEKYPELRQALMSHDGHLYQIMGLDKNQSIYPQARYWVNTKWCENLGISVPTTLEQFYDYLKAVKEGDADQDGDTENEIPMSGAFLKENYSLLTFFLSSLGVNIGYGGDNNYMTVEDDQVIYVPADERFRIMLEVMRQYYSEGLLDVDYFTQSDEQLSAKIATGDVGCYMRWANWLDVTDPELYREWETIVPLTSAYNDTPIWPSLDVSTIGQMVLTDKCTEIDTAMALADWSFTEEAYLVSVAGWPLGTEGYEGGYTVEDFGMLDGVHYFVPTSEYDTEKYANSAQWREQHVSLGWGSVPLCRADWMNTYPPTDERYSGDPDGELMIEMLKLDPYLQVGWPASVPFTDAERDEISLYAVDLTSYVQQMIARFVTGEESLDSYDAYLDGLKARGMDNYLALHQTAFDRYQAN